ncbi:MAG: PAS domain S-box protein, partial [Tepidiformaceae bacterium]
VLTDARAETPAAAAWAIGGYLGVPITLPGGVCVGTFAVWASEAREWTDADVSLVRALGELVTAEVVRRAEGHREQERLMSGLGHFRMLFAANPQPMWVADAETLRFVEVNDAATQLYGFSREEFLQMTTVDLRPSDSEPEFMLDIRAPLEPGLGIDYRQQWRHRTHSGHILYVEVNGQFIEFEGRRARLAVVIDKTARREAEAAQAEAEAALHEADAALARLVATVHEAVVTVGTDLQVRSFNPAAEAMFLCRADDAIGTPLSRFIPALYRDEYEARLLAYGLSGALERPATQELLMLRASGEAFVAEAGVSHGGSGAGEFIGIVLRDVTRQREAESALADSERRYHTLASVALVGIFRLDADGRLIYINEEGERIAGRPSAELLGQGWTSVIHPEDHAAILAEWSTALAAQRPFQREFRLGTPSEHRWVMCLARTERDEEHAIRSYIGTFIDITARRATEEASRAEESRLRTLAEVAPVGLFQARPDGAVTYVNSRVCAITGQPAASLVGRSWRTFIHPDDRARVVVAWEASIEAGTPFRDEFRCIRGDGTTVRVVSATGVERDEDGSIRSFVGSLSELPGQS